jgi:23S rRNA pseudouridine1911/1915/1917 synthase
MRGAVGTIASQAGEYKASAVELAKSLQPASSFKRGPMSQADTLSAEIPEDFHGKRLDQALAALFPDYSRSRLQHWIRDGLVLLDGERPAPRLKVFTGQRVELSLPELPDAGLVEAQNIPLDVIYADEHIAVINKPAGLVMHPAAGNPDGTVQNALLYHFPETAGVPRAGIVHRLDKDTTGLFVVARSLLAHKSLVEQLSTREMGREYRAICVGVPVAGGSVDEPIGRHPVDRKRMAVNRSGREAVTHYRVEARFRAHALLAVKLETGRTHQIRVHLSHQHYPLVGDAVYGGRLRIPAGCSDALANALRGFGRQALHAARLALMHPASGEPMSWQVEMSDDMQLLLAALQADAESMA